MKKIFYVGFFGLLLFEILNVYLIMPMPGSQHMNSIDAAYFLYQWRWAFRLLFTAMIIVGGYHFAWARWWSPAILLLVLVSVIYVINFNMAADHMFYQPTQVLMANETNNKVDSGRLVQNNLQYSIDGKGINHNGKLKSLPAYQEFWHSWKFFNGEKVFRQQ
jgi:hypothetical protein